jgi:hypothetical protein
MKSKISVLFAVLALIASTLACAAGELSLDNPHMSKTSDGAETVTAFASGDTFYVVADLNNATKGTKVSSKWYYEGDEISTDGGAELTVEEDYFTGNLNFSLSSPNGWDAGNYKVELYLNDGLKHTLDFSVQ